MSKAKSQSKVQPRVYSYIRFSTPEQSLGDSERRQLDGAIAFAKRKGLPFDESLRMTDRGLSGFHGTHRKKGALGNFLQSVEAGEVPSGSILVVENVDRLSREGVVDALKTIVFGLIEHGISIETLYPPATFNRQLLDEGRIWELVAHINRANAESRRKSDLHKANWNQKRKRATQEGRILTRMCPAWLRVTDDGTFEVIPEAADTIRAIYDMKLQGIGVYSIAAKLNAEASWFPPPRETSKKAAGEPGNGWRASYIRKLLDTRAVTGAYQPHRKQDGKRVPEGVELSDYFPRIIEPDVFHAVQKLLETNRGKGGQTGKAKNLFVHLVKCGYCGGPMAYVDKGETWVYLCCDNGRRGFKCKRYTIRYDECEQTILDNCHRLQPGQVLPDPGDQAKVCKSLRQRIQGKEGEIQSIGQQLENLVDQITRTTSSTARDRYETKMVELEERRDRLQAERDAHAKELTDAERGMDSFTAWKRNLDALKQGLTTDDVELRVRLRAHLREFIDRIEVFAHGHPHPYDHETDSGDSFAEMMLAAAADNFPDMLKEKSFHEFLDHVTALRMSKCGRFLRVHFKTGAKMNLVPPGSLASGVELKKNRKGFSFVSPDLEQLWMGFIRSRKAVPGLKF